MTIARTLVAAALTLVANVAAAQYQVPPHMRILDRPAENPSHYGHTIEATENLLLIGGLVSAGVGDCNPTVADWYCGATYVYERQGGDWVLINTHIESEAGTSFARFVDDDSYWIHRLHCETSNDPCDYHEVRTVHYDNVAGTFSESAAVQFVRPVRLDFDGRHLAVLDRANLRFFEYIAASDTWSGPVTVSITALFPEDTGYTTRNMYVRNGVAYFQTQDPVGGGAINSIAMVDIADPVVGRTLTVYEYGAEQRHLQPHFIGDQMIIKNYADGIDAFSNAKHVYEEQGGVWTHVGQFNAEFVGPISSSGMYDTGKFLFEVKRGRVFGAGDYHFVMYERDPIDLWQQAGVISIPNGATSIAPPLYDYLKLIGGHGDNVFIRHEGDNTVGYRIFEIPDVKYYLDRDNDRMPDGWEAQYGFPAGIQEDYESMDTDGDRLSDADEFLHITSPIDDDTDDDGMPDHYEIQNTFDPLDPIDGGQDFDGDGVSNAQEYRDWTDPLDASSFKRPVSASGGGGGGGAGYGLVLLLALSGLTRRFRSRGPRRSRISWIFAGSFGTFSARTGLQIHRSLLGDDRNEMAACSAVRTPVPDVLRGRGRRRTCRRATATSCFCSCRAARQ